MRIVMVRRGSRSSFLANMVQQADDPGPDFSKLSGSDLGDDGSKRLYCQEGMILRRLSMANT